MHQGQDDHTSLGHRHLQSLPGSNQYVPLDSMMLHHQSNQHWIADQPMQPCSTAQQRLSSGPQNQPQYYATRAWEQSAVDTSYATQSQGFTDEPYQGRYNIHFHQPMDQTFGQTAFHGLRNQQAFDDNNDSRLRAVRELPGCFQVLYDSFRHVPRDMFWLSYVFNPA